MKHMKDRKVACATLTPEHGVIAPSPGSPGHHSLWLRTKALKAYALLFRVIE
jgi:hypothetical protein